MHLIGSEKRSSTVHFLGPQEHQTTAQQTGTNLDNNNNKLQQLSKRGHITTEAKSPEGPPSDGLVSGGLDAQTEVSHQGAQCKCC